MTPSSYTINLGFRHIFERKCVIFMHTVERMSIVAFFEKIKLFKPFNYVKIRVIIT